MRAILRPGLHVLRRPGGELQVGLDPRHAVLLPDRPEVRATLRALAVADEVPSDATVRKLSAHGLLTSPGALRSAHDLPAPADVAALAGRFGDRTVAALEARAACRVSLTGFGVPLVGPSPMGPSLSRLLESAGVGVFVPPSHEDPDLRVLLGTGEPARELVDHAMRESLPHLLVRVCEGVVTVGPFVVPGTTACLRCVDAHRADRDPAWPLLVAQHAARSEHERADGTPEPVDSLLLAVGLARAAHDVALFAEGEVPATWSSTLVFAPPQGLPETTSWRRHPGCGCAWG